MASYRHILKETRNRVRLTLDRVSSAFEGKKIGEIEALKIRLRKRFSRYSYNVIFAMVLAALLVEPGPRQSKFPELRDGHIVEQDFYSPISADVEPRASTKQGREELAKKVAPIFDYDDSALETWLKKWVQAFRRVRQEHYPSGKPARKQTGLLESISQTIVEITGQTLPSDDILFLHQKRFGPDVETIFARVAEYLLGRLIAPTDLFPAYYSTGIVVRQINQDLTETLIYDLSRIWSLEQAREFLTHVPTLLKLPKTNDTRRTVEFIGHLVIPNLKPNVPLTEKRINTLLEMAKPSIQSVKKGQLVLRKGERATERQVELVKNLKFLMSPGAKLRRWFLTTLMLLVFLGVLFRMELTRKGFWYLPLKDALFFMGSAVLTIACAKYALPYLRIFFGPFHLRFGVEYLMPLSAGGIVIHLMMGKEAAFSFALLISVVAGYLLDRNFFFGLWVLSVSTSAIQSIRACKQRTDLYKCGVWSGTVGAVMVGSYCFIQLMGFQSVDWVDISITIGLSFLSGLAAAILAGSFIPVIETIFGYTTSLKLLELSNFNHPLLHNLMMKAPGTYHHSVIVGSLAEIAADRVKANGLLARVSAYYHDIGKMNKPLYFIENQSPNSNPHDHLSPSMSAKILFSHVKNGARMAREYNLGNKITGIIEQHHGTTLVSYFFNKAKRKENPEHDHVSEADFRYPGPRPQSREAAIVMIADACEAATRSIAEPTPAKIQAMVHNIINRRFLEDQFAECDLTFSDLQLIEDSFTRTLVSLYHHRIEYPGQKKTLPQAAPHIPVPPPSPSFKKGA